jgi:hypothetical protein
MTRKESARSSRADLVVSSLIATQPFIEGKSRMQFRQVHMAISVAAFIASAVAGVLRGSAAIQGPCPSSSLLARARTASRARSSRAGIPLWFCADRPIQVRLPLLEDERFPDKSRQSSSSHRLVLCACELRRSRLPPPSPSPFSRNRSVSQRTDRCHFGDCRDTLRAMITAGVKVQTIVTLLNLARYRSTTEIVGWRPATMDRPHFISRFTRPRFRTHRARETGRLL